MRLMMQGLTDAAFEQRFGAEDCKYARNKDPTPETHQYLAIVRKVLIFVGSFFARNVTPPKKSNSPHNRYPLHAPITRRPKTMEL
jgi:hypothetical protein